MAHCFENKVIIAIEIASDKKAMRFLVEDGEPIVAKADGDCCSSSWIEHIGLPAKGFPTKILSVEGIDLTGSRSYDEGHDCLRVYGLKITTDKGEIVIDYRNASNGYYGGNLCGQTMIISMAVFIGRMHRTKSGDHSQRQHNHSVTVNPWL